MSLSQILEYLTSAATQVESFNYTVSNFPLYTGVYFVGSQPNLLYIGSANKIQSRILGHERHKEFMECAQRLGRKLSFSCIRVDDISIARELEKTCIKQLNPLLNRHNNKTSEWATSFEELTKFSDNFYYESGEALFNWGTKFSPRKLTKQALIYAVKYAIAPSTELKILAHAPYWDNGKYKPVHFDGGEVSGCRPMVDAELKHLYEIRGYDRDRLEEILAERQFQRELYVQSMNNAIRRKKEFEWIEIESFSKFLSVYCAKDPDLKKIYEEYPVAQKVELLHCIIDFLDFPPATVVAKAELRKYY